MTEEVLRRYTQPPALFRIPAERKLTSLDPNSWDDKNDSHFVQQYKEKKKLKTEHLSHEYTLAHGYRTRLRST